MAYDLNDLQLFLEVVDHGSITEGAKRSHMSLASASARVSAMEKALGAPLLTRHRRGVMPSQAGWVLVAHARAIVAEHGRMRARADPLFGWIAGDVGGIGQYLRMRDASARGDGGVLVLPYRH